ncbi:MAG: thioredoxin domain-containing protein [Bryobacteraceae bacterium]|nr:thioredoxin domain-containing protein [Bryobacteraceae bacterium]
MRQGPENAPVHLIIVSDFACPFCRSFAQTVSKALERFDKRIMVDFKVTPSRATAFSEAAAEAALCAAEQDRFWPMHNALFARASLSVTRDLAETAKEAALDTEAWRLCMESGRSRDAWQVQKKDAMDIGITATPTAFVNGRILVGAHSYEQLSPALATFGPSMKLANELLKRGRRDDVVRFLEECRKFWKLDRGRIDRWVREIKAGVDPDFGPNLLYEP